MYDLLNWINSKKSEALKSKISNFKKNAIVFGVEMFDLVLCCLAGFGLGAIIGESACKIISLITKKK